MNKRIFWISAVVVTAFALSFHAFAQPGSGQRGPGGGQRGQGGPGGPGGFGGGANIGMFLQNPEFTKMLELTTEQTSALQEIVQAQRPQGGQGNAPPTAEERRQRMDEMQAKVNAILKPEQQTKFKEIAFQAMGGLDSPFLNDRLLEVVDLTAEQRDKIRKIDDERSTETRNVMQRTDFRNASQEDRDKLRADGETRAKKYGDQIKAVLTAEQKAKAEKLTAGVAELREKLGLPAPGQPGQRGGQGQGRQRQGGQSDDYTPGSQSWQPGQGAPNAPPPPGNRPRFPRNEN